MPASTSNYSDRQFKITIGRDPDHDIVVLLNGDRYFFPAWLNLTRSAVSAIRQSIDTQSTCASARRAHDWLALCGIVSHQDFEDFEKHLPLLDQPSSPSVTRSCRVCGSSIWGRESIVTGIGSGCRRDNGARHAITQIRQAVAA